MDMEEIAENIDNEILAELVPEAADETETLEVNGEEITVSRDEVYEAGKRALQKETAGEEKLRLAAELKADLDERERAILERESLMDVKPSSIGKDFAEAMYSDDDKVAQVISDLDARLSKYEELSQKTAKQVEYDRKAEEARVVGYYHDKYRDIASDDDMHAVFNARLRAVSIENPTLSPLDAVDKAAKLVSERFGNNIKDKMTKQPTTTSKRKLAPTEEKIQSDAEIIEEMRAGRAGN